MTERILCVPVSGRLDELYAAYWAVKSHAEEHEVIQRLLVYEQDPGGWGTGPCQEPECVAIRQDEEKRARNVPVFADSSLPEGTMEVHDADGDVCRFINLAPADLGKVREAPDISAVTRYVARMP